MGYDWYDPPDNTSSFNMKQNIPQKSDATLYLQATQPCTFATALVSKFSSQRIVSIVYLWPSDIVKLGDFYRFYHRFTSEKWWWNWDLPSKMVKPWKLTFSPSETMVKNGGLRMGQVVFHHQNSHDTRDAVLCLGRRLLQICSGKDPAA